MQLKKAFARLLIFIFLPIGLSFANPPTNLYQDKKDITAYYNSGKYTKDIDTVTRAAKQYATHQIAKNNKLSHPKKLAAVFDIDETSLSNYPTLKKNDFSNAPKNFTSAQNTVKDKPIKSILALYNYLEKHHVAIFFVTGRAQNQRAATIKNLKSAGYQGWSGLYLKPQNYHYTSIVPFKLGARKKITQKGYTILMNIGDQWSDFHGGYAKRNFKLPNPFYHTA